MRDKKKIIIGVLCALVAVMAVGYAALASQLNITGTASIDSTWKVEITNITESNIVGDATSKETPSYTATTANFSVGLIQPGDSITYDIEISNLGTLKAKVDSIQVVMDENDAITYTTSGVESGTTLGVGETNNLLVTVGYNSEVTSQPSVTAKDITVTINYVQDLGNEGNVTPEVQAYSIGDTVTFAGSNWYVIDDSTEEQDYVTLLKETVLTNAELGDYGTDYTCSATDATAGKYGCTTEGEVVEIDAMPYYTSDTCYTNASGGKSTGCSGYHDYEKSNVKKFLEETYINTLDDAKLKEVDGYKVRLITLEELQANFGYATEKTYTYDYYYYDYSSDATPTWIYQDFGNSYVTKYWTMTKYTSTSHDVWTVNSDGRILSYAVQSTDVGVRPVINLLKSSI